MKPFDSLSKEVLYKVSGQSTLLGMSPTQVMLGMLSHPKVWKKVPMIQIKTPKLRTTLGLDAGQKLASFEDFFEGSTYKLETDIQKALMMRPSERGTYENDVVKVDERLSIAFMVYYGSLFKIFPLPEDVNHTWLGFPEIFEKLQSEEGEALKRSSQAFIEALFARQYDKASLHVSTFESFAKSHGASIMPSAEHIQAELFFNKAQFFERLTPAYLLLGLLLLIIAFVQVFKPERITQQLKKPLFYAVAFLFTVHTFALLLRWYVSGHAPMSDTYESIIYIAWSCLLFSMIFLRTSLFALAGSSIMAGIFMFVAHLGNIDPEITNLVPVLKSFWLSVHVSVITASYGFLALGCALGFFTLFLFTCKLSAQSIQAIKQLSIINEVSLMIGLTLLVIGNFLGGIWANESWGRYWGWDPKETWAYISIIVYTIILHVRLIPKWHSRYVFAVLSVVGFASILMTYFGVNFYLAGMHSYATGDPVPIPAWVYVTSALVLGLIGVSYKNRKLKEEK
jgi:cytochrome c-type biogenesis protein CcsB